MDPLLTKRQAAEILQLSIPTIDRKIRTGELRAVRLGRAVRIEPDDLREYVNRRESQKKSVGETTGTHCTAEVITFDQHRSVS